MTSNSGASNPRCNQIVKQTYNVVTQYGDMLVVRQGGQLSQSNSNHQASAGSGTGASNSNEPSGGPQTRPVIMTFHDLGLNSELQFASFCECEEVKLMMQTFNMVHVNFIGQEFVQQQQQVACPDLAEDFRYPSVEQLAECIVDVCAQLRIRSFIGLGVGAGAHILSLLALRRPDLVDGLFLINPVVTSCSITEWLYFKMSALGQHHHSEHGGGGSSGASPQRQHPTTANTGLRRLLSAVHLGSVGPDRTGGDGEPRSASVEDTQSLGSRQEPELAKPHGGSRLRKLILSRNFRLSQHHHQHQLERKSNSERRAPETPTNNSESAEHESRRPPVEYLMYHHFGPSSFQRYRRSSDTPSRNSGSSICEEEPPAATRMANFRAQSRSHDSLACQPMDVDEDDEEPPAVPRRRRTDSLSLSAAHLAQLSSERQRLAYVQSVYRHRFGQVNGRNLWLLVQSFAKRKALSLRKDCGAAAHAAAAAAALGTSICTAFVGPHPAEVAAEHPRAQAGAPDESDAGSGGRCSSAQVAGTKVKRTFTCQTLIMCSSVPLHCERAFKLMSLLNPLQATCIKSDQVLVLEERPDKVCRALRLFLQGIGYSMSTYERRLRLSSGQLSASSADSNSSAPSLASDSGR